MKSVQRLYYLLSCRLLLFTEKKENEKRLLTIPYTKVTASAKMIAVLTMFTDFAHF